MYKIQLCVVLSVIALAAAQTDSKIKSEASALNTDGSYQYSYVADNGNSVSESGVGGVVAQGSASWISLEGVPLSIEYVADAQGGFQPKGVHIPTPPPIPPQIARALEYVRTHPPKEETEKRKKL